MEHATAASKGTNIILAQSAIDAEPSPLPLTCTQKLAAVPNTCFAMIWLLVALDEAYQGTGAQRRVGQSIYGSA